jgi:hypothetical protein
MKKKYILMTMITAVLFLSITASSWGISQLWVVRGNDGNLYKKTCTGLSCSGYTLISGAFLYQPTLIWDEYLAKYICIGVGLDGKIYRSTFDVNGNHDGVWVADGGASPSPVGAAAGDIFESNLWYTATGATTTIGSTCTNYSGGTVSFTAPANGQVFVEADVVVIISHTSGTTDFLYLYIGTTPTDCSSSYFMEHVVPSAYPTSSSYQSIHMGEGFPVTAGVTYTYYLNGLMASGQNSGDTFWWGRMKAVFYPY